MENLAGRVPGGMKKHENRVFEFPVYCLGEFSAALADLVLHLSDRFSLVELLVAPSVIVVAAIGFGEHRVAPPRKE